MILNAIGRGNSNCSIWVTKSSNEKKNEKKEEKCGKEEVVYDIYMM